MSLRELVVYDKAPRSHATTDEVQFNVEDNRRSKDDARKLPQGLRGDTFSQRERPRTARTQTSDTEVPLDDIFDDEPPTESPVRQAPRASSAPAPVRRTRPGDTFIERAEDEGERVLTAVKEKGGRLLRGKGTSRVLSAAEDAGELLTLPEREEGEVVLRSAQRVGRAAERVVAGGVRRIEKGVRELETAQKNGTSFY